jgi:hypothetical protein
MRTTKPYRMLRNMPQPRRHRKQLTTPAIAATGSGGSICVVLKRYCHNGTRVAFRPTGAGIPYTNDDSDTGSGIAKGNGYLMAKLIPMKGKEEK